MSTNKMLKTQLSDLELNDIRRKSINFLFKKQRIQNLFEKQTLIVVGGGQITGSLNWNNKKNYFENWLIWFLQASKRIGNTKIDYFQKKQSQILVNNAVQIQTENQITEYDKIEDDQDKNEDDQDKILQDDFYQYIFIKPQGFKELDKVLREVTRRLISKLLYLDFSLLKISDLTKYQFFILNHHLRRMPFLEIFHINLQFNQINDRFIQLVDSIQHLRFLKCLNINLQFNQISTTEFSNVLTTYQHLVTLNLNFWSCGIEDQGIQQIGFGIQCLNQQLKYLHLNLQSNLINFEGFKSFTINLSQQIYLKKLTLIIGGYNNFGQFRPLSVALNQLQKLRFLNLGFSSLQSRIFLLPQFVAMSKMPYLKCIELDISNNLLNLNDCQNLYQGFKKLKSTHFLNLELFNSKFSQRGWKQIENIYGLEGYKQANIQTENKMHGKFIQLSQNKRQLLLNKYDAVNLRPIGSRPSQILNKKKQP